MNKPYPSKISPTPIVSAAIEIKFNINCPIDVVFGVVYNVLKKDYPLYDILPIANIPEQIRINDGLIEQPHYRLYNDIQPYSILIGPKIFVFVYNKENLNSENDYPGWSEFIVDELSRLYKILFELNFITEVTRLGIRYNDFFSNINIFEHTEFNLIYSDGNRKDTIQTQVIQTMQKNNIINNIVISNNSSFIAENTQVNGSMVDIDSYMTKFDKNFMHFYEEYLEKCHELNKELFFDMLKKEFIDTLNANYGE